ncbi:MAG: KOW domain-containing RNA-binding protein [Clostridiales bacterium]
MNEMKDNQPEKPDRIFAPLQKSSSSQVLLQMGQLVRSLAGRDKGSFYLVLGYESQVVLLVNGRKRTPDNPKRKNRRHLQHTGKIAADFADNLVAGEPIRNEDIRQILNGFLENPQG